MHSSLLDLLSSPPTSPIFLFLGPSLQLYPLSIVSASIHDVLPVITLGDCGRKAWIVSCWKKGDGHNFLETLNEMIKNSAPISTIQNAVIIHRAIEGQTAFRNEHGQTAMHLLSQSGPAISVGLLIQTKADLDDRDDCGRTALHLAAKLGRLDVCKILLEGKADPESQDILARTPLHWAQLAGKSETVDLLLCSLRKKPEVTQSALSDLCCRKKYDGDCGNPSLREASGTQRCQCVIA
jgi:hypothetical protein